MAKTLPYIVCFGILLAGSSLVWAQEAPVIKASIDKNEILIGEPLRLSLDVKSPMVSGNQLPQFDSIRHFELIEKGSRDSLISANGASYHLEWKLTSFDSGTRYIPSFAITIGKQIYKTDSLAVEVSYGKVDTAQDYHDIKSIIDIENPDVKYIPWILGAITLVSLVLFVWFIRQRSSVIGHPLHAEPDNIRISPLDEAMISLDQLKKMLHEDPSSVKKYYSGINDTLRVFLNRKLGLITMEKTSEELIHSLSDLRMDRDIFTKLAASLRMGDFVKFAKYIPFPFENENNWEVIRGAIVLINEKVK
ncbi:MAG TPA: BatD family protein [Puia sp.]|nr:BatD family protein [Puia sp.]